MATHYIQTVTIEFFDTPHRRVEFQSFETITASYENKLTNGRSRPHCISQPFAEVQ